MQSRLEQLREKGRIALSTRQYHPYYDSNTYLNFTLFEKFKASKNQHKMLKLIWAYGVSWPCDKFQLALICPDICPIFGTPLDYGRGFNRLFNPNVDNDEGYFQPSIDHRISRIDGGIDDISNYVVVSRKANQFKCDMRDKEELDCFHEGMMRTYFT